jgi:hypothetical protein
MHLLFYKKSGFSILEVLLAIVFFGLLFFNALKAYTESSLPAQAMIRDYAVAMNICERFLNKLENDIKQGRIPPESDNLDVSTAILDEPSIQDYLKIFAGGIGKEVTSLTVNFKAFLTLKKATKNLVELSLNFTWASKKVNAPNHSFELKELVCVEKMVFN